MHDVSGQPAERRLLKGSLDLEADPAEPRQKRYGLDIAAAWAAIGIFAIMAMGVVYLMAPILIPLSLAIVTGLILVLAANTAFNGFPVLGSILARDGFLPRQLHTRGDRLAFSNGILILASAAAALVVIFNADVTRLIQLYIVGVFVSFTLSQTGMVRHWNRYLRVEKDPAARARMMRSRVINGVGATMSGLVGAVILSRAVNDAALSDEILTAAAREFA